jgi:hypothetical protein
MSVDLLVDTPPTVETDVKRMPVEGYDPLNIRLEHLAPRRPGGYGPLIESVCATLGISQAQLARALGTTPRTVSRWKTTSTPHVEPNYEHGRALRDFGRIVWLLGELWGPHNAAAWMRSPNSVLGGRAALDVLMDGDYEKVLGLLECHAEGGLF